MKEGHVLFGAVLSLGSHWKASLLWRLNDWYEKGLRRLVLRRWSWYIIRHL